MTYETITPMGGVINAVDMHGQTTEPFVPFSVRCPQFIELKDGTLVYIVEAKYNSQADEEPACKLLMRSHDGGKTWGESRLLKYKGYPDSVGGVPIYDEVNDTLIYFGRTREWIPGMEQEGRLLNEYDQILGRVLERFWIAKSTDGGLTWSDFKETFIDAPEEWRVKNCPTPGIGIQLKNQKDPSKNGRLIVPSNHIGSNENGRNDFGAHVLVSDDFGDSWHISAIQDYVGGTECMLAELSDGTLILNARSQASIPANHYLQSVSLDGGDTFISNTAVESLYDPCCHSGFDSAVVDGKDYLFLTAPTGELGDPWPCLDVMGRWGKREMMTLYMSADRGQTYKAIRQLSPKDEFAAYSALLTTSTGTLLCAWESGPEDNLYRDIKFTRLDIAELVD